MPRVKQKPRAFFKAYKKSPGCCAGGFLYADSLKATWKPNLPGGCVPSW